MTLETLSLTAARHGYPTQEAVDFLSPADRLAAALDMAATATRFVDTIDQVLAETNPSVLNVDDDPAIRTRRWEARQEAESIVESNMQLLRDGQYDRVPMDVDPGGTARKLVLVGRMFGKESPEYRQVWRGLVRDCERRVAEAIRMKDWELYGTTVMEFDPQTIQFFSDGLCVDQMLCNSLTPAQKQNCPEELPMRVNEFVGIKTDAELIRRPDMHGRHGFVVLQCPQSVIDAYSRNPDKGVVSDYVPSIQKLMIRHKYYDVENQQIPMRQMGVPGIYITNEVVNAVLTNLGANDGQRLLDRTEVQGTQIITEESVAANAVDILRLLDEEASKQHGIKIFRGMPLEPGQKPDYESTIMESERRQKEQVGLTLRYANFLTVLEESGIDREVVGVMADDFMQAELLKIARDDPTKALIMFDVKTAEGLMAVKSLEEQGRYEEAEDLYLQVKKEAPPAGGCGAAGGCGLEALSPTELLLAAELLDLQPGEQTAKNGKDPCKHCGEMTVVYAWSEEVVKTACLSCKRSDVNQKSTKQQPASATVRRPDGEAVKVASVNTTVSFLSNLIKH